MFDECIDIVRVRVDSARIGVRFRGKRRIELRVMLGVMLRVELRVKQKVKLIIRFRLKLAKLSRRVRAWIMARAGVGVGARVRRKPSTCP